jgi:hypothetical protein
MFSLLETHYYYEPTIEQYDGLIMIENVLTLLLCINVQKNDYMNDNYFLCLIDYVFTLYP